VQLAGEHFLAVQRQVLGVEILVVRAGRGHFPGVFVQIDHAAQFGVEAADAGQVRFQVLDLVGQAQQLTVLVLGQLFRADQLPLHPFIIVKISNEKHIAGHHGGQDDEQQGEQPAPEAQLAAGAVLVLEDDDLVVLEHGYNLDGIRRGTLPMAASGRFDDSPRREITRFGPTLQASCQDVPSTRARQRQAVGGMAHRLAGKGNATVSLAP